MISFSPDLSNLTRLANFFSQAGGRSSHTLSKIDVQSQTETGLSIVTAEGDKVTLSTQASFQGTGVKYNARGVVEGQAISLRSNALEGGFSSQKHMTIEGHLNEQELQDINNLVTQVNGLRQDVATGDLDAILENAQQISTTQSIASIDLSIQHSQSLSVQGASHTQESTSLSHASEVPNHNASGPSFPVNSPLGLLESLLKPQGRTSRTREGESQIEHPDRGNAQGKNSVDHGLLGPPSQGLQKDQGPIINGLNSVLHTLSEKISKGVQRIAKLASKLEEKLERQSEKIVHAFEKLSEAVAEGKTPKVERLRNQIDKRIDRIENYTERLGSRIEDAADKVTNLADKLNDRLTQSRLSSSDAPLNASTVPIESTKGEIPQSENKIIAEA